MKLTTVVKVNSFAVISIPVEQARRLHWLTLLIVQRIIYLQKEDLSVRSGTSINGDADE